LSISFDQAAAYFDATRGGEVRGRSVASTLTPLFANTGLTLDVGCGTGVVALGLRQLGRLVIGIDLSAAMLAHARARDLPVLRADAHALPFVASTFFDAYSTWVMHVVSDPQAVFQEVCRVLRPQSHYLVEMVARRETQGDEAARICADFDFRFRKGAPPRDDSALLTAHAQQVGFRLLDVVDRHSDVFLESPNQLADAIENRRLSGLWDLSQADFTSLATPTLLALRALPEAGLLKPRRALHQILVFAKP
jgi:SAM-dependent methyltransferase